MMETTFVAGGSGFIGTEFVRLAHQNGYAVLALARSEKAAEAVSRLGAEPVMGDLLVPGAWQEIAASAAYVVHIAQPQTFGAGRITLARAQKYRAERVQMDANLLGCLRQDTVQRIVYVSGTSYYGDLGGNQVYDEAATPNPKGWGPYVVDALNALAPYKERLPIVEAFPGGVYGPGSWYIEVLKSLQANKRLIGVQGPVRYNSYIHYEDCARALLHLMKHGQSRERYIMVDDRSATTLELAERSAQAVGVPLKTFLLPALLVRLLVGPVITESLLYQQRLSNARLRLTGFEFKFPTIAEGIPDVVKGWRN